jgi:hypothetical protein
VTRVVGFTESDAERIAQTVRLSETTRRPQARTTGRYSPIPQDVTRAIYVVEYHDFYRLRRWDGTDAGRTTGPNLYAWKPGILRPLSANIYTYTVTINGVDSVEVTDGVTTEDWEIKPKIRVNFTDTIIVDCERVDAALCSSQLSADLASAGITIADVAYQDLNIQGRVWAVSQQ